MLTDTKLRHLKPRDKLYRMADSAGLAIEVQPNGALYWRFRYNYAARPRCCLWASTRRCHWRKPGFGATMPGDYFATA